MQTENKAPLLLENLVDCDVLEENERESNKIVDCLGDLLFVIDKNRFITKVNKSTCDFFKKKPEELIGRHCYEIMHGTKAPWRNCPATRTLKTKQISTEEVNDPRLGIPLLVTTSAILDKQGKVSHVIHIAKDITKQKKAEEALMKSQEEYGSLFANMMDGFAYCQMLFDDSGKPADFIYLQTNDAFQRIIGLKRETIVGKKETQAIPGIKEANPELFEIYGKVALTGQTERFEVFLKPLKMWLHISVYCPKKGYFAAIFEDTTERKNVEEAAKKQASLIDLSPDAIIVKNLDETITFWNKGAEKLYGYTKQESLGQKINILLKAKHSRLSNEIISQLRQGKNWTGEITHYTKNNNKVIVQSYWSATLDARGEILEILESNVDITERKEAEETAKFQADLLNHVGQAIIMADNKRIVRFWNKVAEKLYGWSEGEALGHKVTELLGGDPPGEVDEVTRRLMAGESWSTEVFAQNRDGSVVPVILNRTPIFKEDGEFVGAASITTDITLQKNTEADLTYSLTSLSKTLDKIEELNEKLRVVGSLTRHDVRNKLSTVIGYAYILKKKHSDQADVVDALDKMEQAVKDSMKIFDFAKLYEQLGAEELTYVDVEQKIEEAVTFFRSYPNDNQRMQWVNSSGGLISKATIL